MSLLQLLAPRILGSIESEYTSVRQSIHKFYCTVKGLMDCIPAVFDDCHWMIRSP